MTAQSHFTADEWNLLRQAPMAACTAVSMTDLNPIDAFREATSVARQMVDDAKKGGQTGLVGEILASYNAEGGMDDATPQFKSGEQQAALDEAVNFLKQAAALVDAKAAHDAQAYKAWLYDMAVVAAKAAKSGDVMGIGGVRVSEAEQAQLDKLAALLGVAK